MATLVEVIEEKSNKKKKKGRHRPWFIELKQEISPLREHKSEAQAMIQRVNKRSIQKKIKSSILFSFFHRFPPHRSTEFKYLRIE